jgi:hypothetical protein
MYNFYELFCAVSASTNINAIIMTMFILMMLTIIALSLTYISAYVSNSVFKTRLTGLLLKYIIVTIIMYIFIYIVEKIHYHNVSNIIKKGSYYIKNGLKSTELEKLISVSVNETVLFIYLIVVISVLTMALLYRKLRCSESICKTISKTTFWVVMLMSLTACKRSEEVIIEAPTSVYEDYPGSGAPTSKIIAILNKGTVAEFVYARYAKDCEYLKIRLKDGRTGYVGWDGKYSVYKNTQ